MLLNTIFHLIQRHWLTLTILLALIITILSLSPLPDLPAVPGTDKTHHFIAYSALVFPVALARPTHWMWLVIGLLGFSGMIELIQPYVNRYGEWLDLAANTGGLFCGCCIASVIRRMLTEPT